MATAPDWRTLNRAMWDEKVSTHLCSPVYDIEGFKAGRNSLRVHEMDDLMPVSGKSLIHLQCHIGLDTMSWTRLGASATGLDFSPASIDAASGLAGELGLDTKFVVADVYDAPAVLRGTFDVVYTGVGALCWLPDVIRWAAVVHDLLRPGGELYLFEFHPVEWIFERDVQGAPTLREHYFTPAEGYRGGSVSYADDDVSASSNPTIQWNHSLGDVVMALIQAGLRIDALRELGRSVVRNWEGMEKTADGMFAMAPDKPSLPLMYVLRARKGS